MSLFGVGLSVLGVASDGQPVLAQVLLGQATPIPPGLSGIFTNPGEWMTSVINAMLLSVGQRTNAEAVGFMNWLLGSGNVINQTPPALSYDNEAVGHMWNTMRIAANGGLAAVTVWGGVNIMRRATGIPVE
jgi:hypothetical protein